MYESWKESSYCRDAMVHNRELLDLMHRAQEKVVLTWRQISKESKDEEEGRSAL